MVKAPLSSAEAAMAIDKLPRYDPSPSVPVKRFRVASALKRLVQGVLSRKTWWRCRPWLLLLLWIVGLLPLVWSLATCPRINMATFEAIEIGMSEDDVTRLVGVPTGNYGVCGSLPAGIIAVAPLTETRFSSTRSWSNDAYILTVGLDDAGKVKGEVRATTRARDEMGLAELDPLQ